MTPQPSMLRLFLSAASVEASAQAPRARTHTSLRTRVRWWRDNVGVKERSLRRRKTLKEYLLEHFLLR